MTRNQLLTLILQEVLRISQQTKYAAYYNYHGHTDSVTIHVAEGKENDECSAWMYDQSVYMGAGMTNPLPKLQDCIDHLKTYA